MSTMDRYGFDLVTVRKRCDALIAELHGDVPPTPLWYVENSAFALANLRNALDALDELDSRYDQLMQELADLEAEEDMKHPAAARAGGIFLESGDWDHPDWAELMRYGANGLMQEGPSLRVAVNEDGTVERWVAEHAAARMLTVLFAHGLIKRAE